MFLSHLYLQNFRNYSSQSVAFSAPKTILLGDNAQGKSNLLEAVELLATLKSHRTSRDRDLVKEEASTGHIKDSELQVALGELVHLEAHCWRDLGGLCFLRLEAVDNSCLSTIVQAYYQNAHRLLAPPKPCQQPLEQAHLCCRRLCPATGIVCTAAALHVPTY